MPVVPKLPPVPPKLAGDVTPGPKADGAVVTAPNTELPEPCPEFSCPKVEGAELLIAPNAGGAAPLFVAPNAGGTAPLLVAPNAGGAALILLAPNAGGAVLVLPAPNAGGAVLLLATPNADVPGLPKLCPELLVAPKMGAELLLVEFVLPKLDADEVCVPNIEELPVEDPKAGGGFACPNPEAPKVGSAFVDVVVAFELPPAKRLEEPVATAKDGGGAGFVPNAGLSIVFGVPKALEEELKDD